MPPERISLKWLQFLISDLIIYYYYNKFVYLQITSENRARTPQLCTFSGPLKRYLTGRLTKAAEDPIREQKTSMICLSAEFKFCKPSVDLLIIRTLRN